MVAISRLAFTDSEQSVPATVRSGANQPLALDQGRTPAVLITSKHHLHLHPHTADAAVGEAAVQEPPRRCAYHVGLFDEAILLLTPFASEVGQGLGSWGTSTHAPDVVKKRRNWR